MASRGRSSSGGFGESAERLSTRPAPAKVAGRATASGSAAKLRSGDEGRVGGHGRNGLRSGGGAARRPLSVSVSALLAIDKESRGHARGCGELTGASTVVGPEACKRRGRGRPIVTKRAFILSPPGGATPLQSHPRSVAVTLWQLGVTPSQLAHCPCLHSRWSHRWPFKRRRNRLPLRSNRRQSPKRPAAPPKPQRSPSAFVPGSGTLIDYAGDDFEDPAWSFIHRHPKSSREQDQQLRGPMGRSTNDRWHEGPERGQPDQLETVPTPEGGLDGSTRAS